MRFRRVLSLILTVIMLLLSSSLTAYGEQDEQLENELDFSSELEVFLDDNAKYSTTAEIPNNSGTDEYIPVSTNRLIVSTNSNVSLTNTYGAVDELSGYNNWHILQYADEESAATAFEYFTNQKSVNYVEYDKFLNTYTASTYSSDSESISWGAQKVQSTEAIKILKNSKISCATVVVAVIDTGVDINHPFFKDSAGNMRIIASTKTRDDNPDTNVNKYYHGTHVAGIIVDNTPSNIKIRSYNSFYSNGTFSTVSTVAAEIDRAVKDNVDVINISQGGSGKSPTIEEAVDTAVEKGIVVVASAGNEGSNAQNYHSGNIEQVITVASTTSADTPRSDSNYGSVVDISAPGSNINSTLPNGKYGEKSGTSMAAPFVSAAAAILKSTNKGLSPERICEILTDSAYKPGGWNTSKYGTGIVNFKNMLAYVTMPAPKITLSSDGKISITSNAGNNAKYYYTVDGSIPNNRSKNYTKSFYVPSGATAIKAIAYVDGTIKSSVATYPIQVHEQITVYYKRSELLSLPEDATNVSYYVDDESVVSVKEGKATGLKIGKAVITVKMNANRIYYYHVTVDFAWWQLFHRIIYNLFGILI